MKRKRKRFLAWLLSAALIVSLLPCMAVQAETTIKLGDYVQMGTYYDEPILWRCVSFEKIKGYDNEGNPIMDATDTVTEYKDGYLPLMISNSIICFKPFDAAGNVASGSHGRGNGDGYGSGKYGRRTQGSNYWGDSNIRCWLNSNATAGNINWQCGNPPSIDNVYDGFDSYDNESGFMLNFSKIELNSICSVTQKSFLDPYEYTDKHTDTYLRVDNKINISNYDTADYEYITDYFFLLDIQQVKNIGNNFYNNNSGMKMPEGATDAAINHSNGHRSSSGKFLLRTPNCATLYGGGWGASYRVINASSFSSLGVSWAYVSDGIRPAFFLSENTKLSSGNGTESSPYTVDGSGSYTPATEAPTPTPTAQPTSLKIYCNEPSLSTTVGNVFIVGAAMQDENGNYGSPEDITFDIEDESILRAVKTTGDGETRQLTFNALKEGTTVIKVTDKATGQTGELSFTVNKANGNAYTIYNIPNLGDDEKPNFNNFAGLYVDSFKVNRQSSGSAVVSFDVYNQNYTSASVEVYNADGEMTD
ncbi:MAG: DUF6273 domain-containing protein, partial [Candidatus Ornithomonoglobus sp.]